MPDLIDDLAGTWSLRIDHPVVWVGFGGVAVSVTRGNDDAVLKVSFSESERDLENEALAIWAGRRAVRMLERDDHRHARLLPRLPGSTLFELVSAREAMAVSGALAADLAVKPPTAMPSLADRAQAIADGLARRVPTGGLTRRDIDVAVATYRGSAPISRTPCSTATSKDAT